VPVPVVPPLPVSPEPPPESVGESVGLSLPVSVGVAVGLSLPVSVGVGDAVGVGDVSLTVGVADVEGTPPDVAGVGVTDGVGDAHVGVGDGDGDGDGRADARRVRTSSSAVRSLAEVVVPATVAGGGTDEAGGVLVTSAVTDAAQVAEVVGRADAAPRDLVAPVPRAEPLAPDCAPPAP
jgi:hypothetical protein